MKIEAVTLRTIRMPLVKPFETSFGPSTVRNIVLVQLHAEGIDGWGECVAAGHPYYSEESTASAWHIIEDYLGPAIVGQELGSGQECPSLFKKIRGHRMAKGAMENAVWDAVALQKKVPLWTLLGGSRTEINCGVSIGIQASFEQLKDAIALELEAGYQRIKLKCKPGWDVNIFKKVRGLWPGILLSCDANAAYSLEDVDHLREFDAFYLLMIEQPLWNDDLYFHAELQRQLRTRICLDESIRSVRDARAAIALGSCKIINIKVGRVGGFTEAIRIHDFCENSQIPVWCGGMLESGIGRSHNIALSTLNNFVLPGDISASKRYWAEDIVDPPIAVTSKGTISAPSTPGRGFRVDVKLIEKLTVRKKEITTHCALA